MCRSTCLDGNFALRQQQGQCEAEEQQQRLKSAVENRIKLVQDVNETLKQRVHKLNEATAVLSPDVDHGDSADIALFEEYLQDMDVIYAQTDDAFRASGVEETPLMPYRVGPDQKWIGGLQYFEFLDVLPIPFSFEQTCSVMWESILRSHGKEGRKHYSSVTNPDNTMAVNFRVACPRKSGEPANFMVHFVTRRYIEPSRMIIVWKALTEGEKEFSGMHSDETGWSVVHSYNSDEAAMVPTVMKTFLHCMPTRVLGESCEKEDLKNFAKLVMEAGEEDGLETARLMESLVINDSLNKDLSVTK